MFIPWSNFDLFLTGGLCQPHAQSLLEQGDRRDQAARHTAGRRNDPAAAARPRP